MIIQLFVPKNILTDLQIDLLKRELADKVLDIVRKNFPDLQDRIICREMHAGEIVVLNTERTQPIFGLKDGVRLMVSSVTYEPSRDYDGFARDAMNVISEASLGNGQKFMESTPIFVQMSLDRPVRKDPDGIGDEPDGIPVRYIASQYGKSLLEFSSEANAVQPVYDSAEVIGSDHDQCC